MEKLIKSPKTIILTILILLISNISPLQSQKRQSSRSKDKKKTVKVDKSKQAKIPEKLEIPETTDIPNTDTATVKPEATGDKPVKKSKAVTGSKGKQEMAGRKMATNLLDPEDDSMSGQLEWNVVLKDDNGNVNLPERYRTWWYVRLDGVSNENPTRLNIIGDGFAGKSIVIPVFSYDRVNWHRLRPDNIVNNSGNNGFYNYTIEKVFDSSTTVWLARYFPYSTKKLEDFLKTIEKNPYAKTEKIGTSTLGRPMFMVTITDPKVDDKKKKRVWIHARTHPSETGSSFIVEGLIKYLLSPHTEYAKETDLSKLIFNIVPMVNPDGVALGNGRVTPDSSYDLERMWFRAEDAYSLKDTAPSEITSMHSTITKLIKQGPEFIIALNLHTKNAPPDWRSFLYSNFKRKNDEYGEEGDTLFRRQLQFAKLLSNYYCMDTISVRQSEEAAKPMDKKLFPEVWWWLNFKDKVMAVTLETTSGYNGCYEEWVTYKDHLKLGESIARSCNQYYKYFISGEYYRYERPCENIEELMEFYK